MSNEFYSASNDFFPAAYKRVRAHEGGDVNHPADTGRLTSRGVTQATYDRYRKDRIPSLSIRSVTEATSGEIRDVFFSFYWLEGKCNRMWTFPLALVHFDGCVNHGVYGASRILQRGMNVLGHGPLKVDGSIGSKTLLAFAELELADEHNLTEALLWERLRLYSNRVQKKPDQIAFLRGWLNRILSLKKTFYEERTVRRPQ